MVVGSALAAPAAIAGVASAMPPTAPDPAPRTLAGRGDAPATPLSLLAPDAAEIDAAAAFWDAGYQFCDAVALADAHEGDTWAAKVAAGAALRDGATVVPPSGCDDAAAEVTSADSASLEAFWDAGYLFCDAEALAASVGAAGPFEAKVAVGASLLAGTEVPAPSGCTS